MPPIWRIIKQCKRVALAAINIIRFGFVKACPIGERLLGIEISAIVLAMFHLDSIRWHEGGRWLYLIALSRIFDRASHEIVFTPSHLKYRDACYPKRKAISLHVLMRIFHDRAGRKALLFVSLGGCFHPKRSAGGRR